MRGKLSSNACQDDNGRLWLERRLRKKVGRRKNIRCQGKDQMAIAMLYARYRHNKIQQVAAAIATGLEDERVGVEKMMRGSFKGAAECPRKLPTRALASPPFRNAYSGRRVRACR